MPGPSRFVPNFLGDSPQAERGSEGGSATTGPTGAYLATGRHTAISVDRQWAAEIVGDDITVGQDCLGTLGRNRRVGVGSVRGMRRGRVWPRRRSVEAPGRHSA